MNNELNDNDNTIIRRNSKQHLTQEAIRLKQYKKQSTRLTRLSTIMEQLNMGIIEPSLKECMVSLLKDPTQRTSTDNLHITNFLLKSELATKFRMDNFGEDNLNELLSLISTEMKHFFLEKNKILFHIGDDGDNFYLILQGRVSILKPILSKDQITGFQYFTHLMTLYTSNENYLLKLTLENNKKLINIHKSELEDLSLIIFKICLEDYFSRTKYSNKTLSEISKMCFVPSFYFDDIITSDIDEITNPLLLKKEEKELFDRLERFNKQTIKKYRILANDSIKFNVNLYKYTTKLWLQKGNYFGDVALDQYTTRNATIRTEDDTHFCYIDYTHYNNCLRYEKQKLNIKEISFLVDNYFFKSMQYKDFEKKIFVCFECQQHYKNNYICIENDPVRYLYFIREGQIELTIYKSMNDIFQMIRTLRKKVNIKEIKQRQLVLLPKDPYIKDVTINMKMRNKIFVLNQIELIGLECLYYDVGYLYSAQVVSDKAKVYRIEIEHILKILKDRTYGKELMVNYKESAIRKMEIFINRIHDLYDLKLEKYNKRYNINVEKVVLESGNDMKNGNNVNCVIESKMNELKEHKKACGKYKYKYKNKELNLCCNGNDKRNYNSNNSLSPKRDIFPILSPQISSYSLYENNLKLSRRKNFSQECILNITDKEKESLGNNHDKILSFSGCPIQKVNDTFKCEDLLLNRLKENVSRDKEFKKELLRNKLDFVSGVDFDVDKPSNFKYLFRDPVIYKIYNVKKKEQSLPKFPFITKIDLGKEEPKFAILGKSLYYRYKRMKKKKGNKKVMSLKNSFSATNFENTLSVYNTNSRTIINSKNNNK